MESNLLENSLVHLLDAVDRLDETIPDIISLKYSVFHLWSGIRLLLEKRLSDELRSRTCGDKSDSHHPQSRFTSSGDAPLDFKDLKENLSALCGIDIDKYDYVLNKIRKDYDKIENSQFRGSKVQIAGNLVEVWPFIVDFISKHIGFANDSYSKNLFAQTCEIMDTHLNFIRNKKNELNDVLLNQLKESYYAKPLKCPVCLQDAIPLLPNSDTNYSCSFCYNTMHGEQLAFKCGSDLNYLGPFDCLNCSSQGVLRTKDQWVCLSCCQDWALEQISICNLCGERLCWSQQDTPYCNHCKRS